MSTPQMGSLAGEQQLAEEGHNPVSPRSGEPVRVLRVIGRLNIGGPAIQVITLTRLLEDAGYVTTLVRGQENEREGSMDDLAEAWGVHPLLVKSMRRDPGWRDLNALAALVRLTRRVRPHIVHTHAAKAGTLGRLATILAWPNRSHRPLLVHTFHGHSLNRGHSPTKAFSARTVSGFTRIERILAQQTDKLIAVSSEVRDELVDLGIAPPEKFEVVHLGFDLTRFSADERSRQHVRLSVRDELGISPTAKVVTVVARLVRAKRIDRFLRACMTLADLDDVRFLIVGDGDQHDSLRASREALALGDRVIWTGFRRDIPQICFASDLVALSSDVEGTPVCLIEAAAAGVPAVTMDVQGTSTVVLDGRTGVVVPFGDEQAFARALRRLLTDSGLREKMGAEARKHALAHFTLDRLVGDIDGLYERLLLTSDA